MGLRKLSVVAAALVAALALGCQGEKGDTGATGPKGPEGAAGATGETGAAGTDGKDGTNGTDGVNAVDTGTLTGLLTLGTGTVPAQGVSVDVLIAGSTTSVLTQSIYSGDDGRYTATIPIGVYDVLFGGLATDGYEPIKVVNVGLAAGKTLTVDKGGFVNTNPITTVTVVGGSTVYQVGFDQTVNVTATANSTKTDPIAFKWEQTAGPPVTITNPDVATLNFKTRALDDLINTSLTQVPGKKLTTMLPPLRHEVMNVETQNQTELAYTFRVTATQGDFTRVATVTVRSASWNGGDHTVPVGVRMIVGAPTNLAGYSWALTVKPTGSTAALDVANKQYTSFIPDKQGLYTITEGAFTKNIIASNFGSTIFGTAAEACAGCHAANPAFTAIRTEWLKSGHANLFQMGIDGQTGTPEDPNHYAANCIVCHTTGYYQQANNGGFDDVAAVENWVTPAIKDQKPGNYAALSAKMQAAGKISCENCHGPAAAHMAGNDPTLPADPRDRISVNYNAGACTQCHNSGSHHDRGMLWEASGHANTQLAMDEGTSTSCGRCHGAQGYVAYAKQLQDTTLTFAQRAGNLPSTFFTAAGITSDNIEPVTCQACHDAHSGELRLEERRDANGAVLPLPLANGVNVAVGGKGQLCMSCHNTRNGLHDDTVGLADFRAPHSPSQADIFLGKNAYFVSGYNLSKHAAAKDSCVTCHVDIKATGLASLPSGYVMSNTNHTFKANEGNCESCHSSYVGLQSLQEDVELAFNEMAALTGQKLYNALNAEVAGALGGFTVAAYDAATDKYSNPALVNATTFPVDAKTFSFATEIHGRMGLCFTAKAPVAVTWPVGGPTTSSVTDVCVRLEDIKKNETGGLAVVPTGGTIGKALWNYYLIHGDGSLGLHNPTFVYKVITNTEQALMALP